jgi:hypothetical protein
MAYTEEQLALRIKEKYPQYQGVDNSELVSRVLDKYPVYREKLVVTDTPVGQGTVLKEGPTNLEMAAYRASVGDIPPEDEETLTGINQVIDSTIGQFNRGVASLPQFALDLAALPYNVPIDIYNYAIQKAFEGDEELIKKHAIEFRAKTDIMTPLENMGVIAKDDPEGFVETAFNFGGTGVLGTGIFGTIGKAIKTGRNALKSKSGRGVLENMAVSTADEMAKAPLRLGVAETLASAAAAGGQQVPGPQWFKDTMTLLAGGAGGFAPYLRGLKVKNKSTQQVIEEIATGEIEYKDFKPLSKPKPSRPKTEQPGQPIDEIEPAMPGVLQNEAKYQATRMAIAERLAAKEIAFGIINSQNIEGVTGIGASLRTIIKLARPSKVLGQEGMDIIREATGLAKSADAVGERLERAVTKRLKVDPNARDKVNEFLSGKPMDESLKPIEAELLKFDEMRLKFQNILLRVLDDDIVKEMDPDVANKLSQIIRLSIDQGDYTTTKYRRFIDKEWKPKNEKQLTKAAQKELVNEELKLPKYSGMDKEAASAAAELEVRKRIIGWEQNRGAGTKVLKAKGELGPATRAYLGEIVEPGERMFGTLASVGRAAALKLEDLELYKYLLKTGLGTREPVRKGQVQFVFRSGSSDLDVSPGLYIDKDLDMAMNLLRYQDLSVPSKNLSYTKEIARFWDTAVSASKIPKVLLNIESYPVALEGAIMASLANGVIPNGDVLRGFRLALSDYGGLDFLLLPKSGAARKALYDDIEEMNVYGLSTRSIVSESVSRGMDNSYRWVKGIPKKAADFFSKAYTSPDVALRFVNWKAMQRKVRAMYPDADEKIVKRAAAEVVNNTFPNYDRLSNTVRVLERAGIYEPFIAFRLELARNTWHQGRYAKQMIGGRFGQEFGLDPSTAVKGSMLRTGAIRGAALGAVTVGSKVGLGVLNKSQGLDSDGVRAFNETIARDYNLTSPLGVTVNEDGRSGSYYDATYLVPTLDLTKYFDAGFSGQPINASKDMFIQEILGVNLVQKFASQEIIGYDTLGRPLNISQNDMDNAVGFLGRLWDNILKPGTLNTKERLQKAYAGQGPMTPKEAWLRLLGRRSVPWDAERSGRTKIRGLNELSNENKRRYASMRSRFERGEVSEAELEESYQRSLRGHASNMEVIQMHNNNLKGGTWKFNTEERIKIMKDAGMSTLDILATLDNRVQPIKRERSVTPSDVFDNMRDNEGNPLTLPEKRKEIVAISKDDPLLARKLDAVYKSVLKANEVNATPRQKLIAGADNEYKVEYLLSIGADKNTKLMREMQRVGIATKEVQQMIELRSKGY